MTKIDFISVEYELSAEPTPSKQIAKYVQYPEKIRGFSSSMDKATDNTYLHVVAEIKLLGAQEGKNP